MKNPILLSMLLLVFCLVSCGHYGENIEKGKKAKCKLDELQKQVAADPSKAATLELDIKQNLDWIKLYREDSGDPAKFDAELAAHTCN